jgi:hypothetical protein
MENKDYYIVEIRKYHPKGSTPYTEFSCLFLSDDINKAIKFIKESDYEGDYHWYWVIIRKELNEDSDGEIVVVFDKYGNETDERIMLDL